MKQCDCKLHMSFTGGQPSQVVLEVIIDKDSVNYGGHIEYVTPGNNMIERADKQWTERIKKECGC